MKSDRRKCFIEKHQYLIISILINIILLVVGMCMHPISEMGDDDIMTAMSAGCFGEPTAYIFFINYFWAYVIKICVEYLPMLNWFLLIEYLLVFFSLTTISYVILKNFSKKSRGYLTLIILIPFAYEGYVTYTFTKTAGILMAAGMFYLMYCFYVKKRIGFSALWGLYLALLGSCYRFAMAAAVFAMFFGAIACKVLIEKIYRKERLTWRNFKKKEYMILCLVIVGMFGLRYADKAMYSSPEWQSYKEYNYYRGEVRDFPIHTYTGNEKEYEEIGISEVDYENLQIWNFADGNVYSTEKMKAISELKDANGKTAKVAQSSMVGLVDFVFHTLLGNKMFVVCLLVVIYLLFIVKEKTKLIVDIALVSLEFFGFHFIMYMRGRYGQNRVDICIWLAYILVLLSCCFVYEKKESFGDKKTIKKLSLCTLCAISIMMLGTEGKQHFKAWEEEKRMQASYLTLLEYVNEDKTGHYFMDASTAHYGYGTAWNRAYPQDYCENLIWLGGWYLNSPLAFEQWEQNGVTNPMQDMCEMEESYVIDQYNHIGIIVDYLREHYNSDIDAVLVNNVEKYSIYKIVSENKSK